MAYYKDLFNTITGKGIRVRGIPFPIVSLLLIPWEEIEDIELISCSFIDRFRVAGPSSLKTWWGFDPTRLLKGKAIRITLREPILSFKYVVLTGSDVTIAFNIAHSYLK